MSTATQLSENSHQGFDGLKAALCLASTEFNSNTAPDLSLRLWQNRRGSRSSGKERDAETGLDYFLARYYSGALGRFTSVDPVRHPSQSKVSEVQFLSDPDRWNGYAYAGNNPLKFIDIDGLEKYVTIYVRQPVPGTNKVYTRLGQTGHAFLGIKDTDKNIKMIRGFYPKDGKSGKHPINPLVNQHKASGEIRNDENTKFNVSRDYLITDDQYSQLSAKIEADTSHPPDFDLNDFNCTDWAISTIGTIGIKFPDPQGVWPKGGGSNPGMFGQAIADENSADEKKKDEDKRKKKEKK